MKLASDWRRILRHAWSVRFWLLAIILFDAGAVVAPMLGGDSIGWTLVCTVLGSLAGFAGFGARFIAQKEFEDDQTQA